MYNRGEKTHCMLMHRCYGYCEKPLTTFSFTLHTSSMPVYFSALIAQNDFILPLFHFWRPVSSSSCFPRIPSSVSFSNNLTRSTQLFPCLREYVGVSVNSKPNQFTGSVHSTSQLLLKYLRNDWWVSLAVVQMWDTTTFPASSLSKIFGHIMHNRMLLKIGSYFATVEGWN